MREEWNEEGGWKIALLMGCPGLLIRGFNMCFDASRFLQMDSIEKLVLRFNWLHNFSRWTYGNGCPYELGFNFQSNMQFKQTWGRLDIMNAHMISHFCVSFFKCHLNKMCVIQSFSHIFWVQTTYIRYIQIFSWKAPFHIKLSFVVTLFIWWICGTNIGCLFATLSCHTHGNWA